MGEQVNSGVSVLVAQQTVLFESGGAIPTTPHQLKIKVISAQTASQLNELYHSRLPKIHWSNIVRNTHYVCYGFFFNSTALGVAIWSSPVAQNRFKDGKTILELRRLALNEKCPKNTATWALGKMVKFIKKRFPDIKKLVSYQDTDVHKGTIYKAGNWVIGTETGFVSWSTKKRDRNLDQSTAKKIRWEYDLKVVQ